MVAVTGRPIVAIHSSSFEENVAATAGGALYLPACDATIVSSEFVRNTASTQPAVRVHVFPVEAFRFWQLVFAFSCGVLPSLLPSHLQDSPATGS